MNKTLLGIALLSLLAGGLFGYWVQANLSSSVVKPYGEVWLDSDITVMTISNTTTSLDWTELDLSLYVPEGTEIVKLLLNIKIDVVGTGSHSDLNVRKHGTTPSHFPQIKVDSNSLADVKYREFVEVGVSDDLKIDYAVAIGVGWQIDARIILLGYVAE